MSSTLKSLSAGSGWHLAAIVYATDGFFTEGARRPNHASCGLRRRRWTANISAKRLHEANARRFAFDRWRVTNSETTRFFGSLPDWGQHNLDQIFAIHFSEENDVLVGVRIRSTV
jgi:hypothetical protein